MKSVKHLVLISLLVLSGILASGIGFYKDMPKFIKDPVLLVTDPPVETSMLALHDGSLHTVTANCFRDTILLPLSNLLHLTVDSGFYRATNSDNVEETPEIYTETTSEPDSESEAPSSEPEEDLPLEFTRVNDSYFHDAVFIGDSRTVGIEAYAGFENTTFYAATSLSIYDFRKKKITIGDTKMTIEEALQQNQFKKVYLMVGINEAGTGTPDTYYEAYKDVVDEICELQPDALIFIEANLHVTEEKSKSDPVINNENIEARNKKIASLADQKRIFYIDINESTLCDKDGNLRADYTWDQVHLQAQYYPIWKQYIMKKGIVKK